KEIFLKKCLKVFSSVLSVFNVSKGERVGYSNGFIANHNIKVACIMLGYADGFSRLLKNNYTVYINKIKCPLIGNLCMDMMMIDVSNVKNVKEGDKVLVFYDAAKVGKITKEGVYQALVSLNNIRK
ncbi:MAG: alanine racemase C-terminal domain-containing protein, partial [Clostridia bacterium]